MVLSSISSMLGKARKTTNEAIIKTDNNVTVFIEDKVRLCCIF